LRLLHDRQEHSLRGGLVECRRRGTAALRLDLDGDKQTHQRSEKYSSTHRIAGHVETLFCTRQELTLPIGLLTLTWKSNNPLG
jgi:hypothetical protein